MPLTARMKFFVVPYQNGFRVMSSDGAFFSTEPLTEQMAKRQQRALYAKARKGHVYSGGSFTYLYHQGQPHLILKGEGFLGNFFSKVKQIANKAIGAVTGAVQTVAQRVGAVSQGIRDDYPPRARETLAKYGDGMVVSLLVRREPIQSMINTALNFITRGQWNKAKDQMPYDKLYHLSMVASVVMPDGSTVPIVIEKNEVINISTDYKSSGKMEFVNIPVTEQLTLRQMMDKAQAAGDAESWWRYDAFSYNCQAFINRILDANGLNSPQIQSFVLQDVNTLLQKLPSYTSPLARTMTNLAGLANVAMYGRGPRRGRGRGKKAAAEITMAPSDFFKEHRDLVGMLRGISAKLEKEANDQAHEAAGWRKKLQKGRGKCLCEGHRSLCGGVIDKESFLKRQARGVYPAGLTYEQFVGQENAQRARIDKEVAQLAEQNKQYTEFIKQNPEYENVVCKVGEDLEPAKGREVVPKAVCDDRHRRRNQKLNDATPFGKILKGLTTVGDVLTSVVPMPGIVKKGWDVAKGLSGQTSYLDGGCDSCGTHRENVLKRYKLADRSYSLAELSKISKVPLAILRKVYNRGVGAYKTQPTSVRLKGSFVKNVDAPMSAKLSKEQWGYARVYSFLDGNPAHDNDLRANKGAGRDSEGRLIITDEDRKAMRRAAVRAGREARARKSEKLGRAAFYQRAGPAEVLPAARDPSRRAPATTHAESHMEAEQAAKEPRAVYPPVAPRRGRGAPAPAARLKAQIEAAGMTPAVYLRKARAAAKRAGYDAAKLVFADDNKHKLMMARDDGAPVKFGAAGYGDFLLHSAKDKAAGEKARKAYLARAKRIKGDWAADKFSPNSLAISVLW